MPQTEARAAGEPPLWSQGWLSRAEHIESPNQGPRPPGTTVDLVILHSISLPPGEYGGDAIERLFTNRLDFDAHPYFQTIRGLQVSAHFLVRRTGLLQQFVSCDQRAWHAGTSCFEGREGCNDYSIGIELEGLEGDAFAEAQYPALQRLMDWLAQAYPIRAVAGHEHVAPGRKNDPGAGFDWPRLARSLPTLQASWPPQADRPGIGPARAKA